MLFLSEEIFKSRRKLLAGRDHNATFSEEDFRRMLELDPDDFFALSGLSSARFEAGDTAGAEELGWRALRANPTDWGSYAALSRQFPWHSALATGLAELAARKLLLDEPAMEQLAEAPFQSPDLAVEGFDELERREQVKVVAEALHRGRELEPLAVTAQLRPFRLVHKLQESEALEPAVVDALVAEGESIVPLLVGVLRAWAQDFVAEDDEGMVENALGLLGEIGSASALEPVLEFTGVQNTDLSGAASWAVNRILEQHPKESARALAQAAPQLGVGGRIGVLQGLLSHPRLDPTGELLKRLSDHLDRLAQEELRQLFPLLLTVMIATGGRAGLQQARALLQRTQSLLPRKDRWEAKELVDSLALRSHVPMPAAEPSPYTIYEICAGEALWDLDEDEEEYVPPEPVRRKEVPGRNDPCWCGSGKKYKKCHLDRDEEDGPSEKTPEGEFDALRRQVGEFLAEQVPKRDSRRGLQEFGAEPSAADPMQFVDWMIHDYTAPCFGRTVMAEFLHRHGSGLNERERRFIESSARSYFALYEVQQVSPGSGVEVKDLHSGEVCFVHDISISNRAVRWDGVLARRVEGERGQEFTGVCLSVPRQQLEQMRLWLEEQWRASGLSWPEYLKRNLPSIRLQPEKLSREWLDGIRLSNRDGEQILYSKAVYRVLEPLPVSAALQSSPEWDAEEDGGQYTWLGGRPGEDGRTVLGTLRMQSGELTLECNSRERLERGKKLLDTLAGDALRHVRDEFTPQEEIKRRVMEEPSGRNSGQDEIPPEVRDRVVSEVLERHFATWPDTALPALDGQTPRQAARTAAGRRKLEALLRDFENNEERMRKAGAPVYGVARLRAELGLTKDEP